METVPLLPDDSLAGPSTDAPARCAICHTPLNPADGNGFSGSNTISADPHLGPLGDNGGLTQTMALLNGSPAIDAGIAVNGITADQRGIVRPQGSAPDIGAFEARQVRPVFATASLNDFPTDAPYDLVLASEPSPAGGLFSGIGVNSGIFSPAQAALGSNVIGYAVVSLDNITTTASLVINLSLPPFSSWQMLQNLPADGSQDLANPSGDA